MHYLSLTLNIVPSFKKIHSAVSEIRTDKKTAEEEEEEEGSRTLAIPIGALPMRALGP